MKYICTFAVALTALFATQSFAEEGRVSRSTLASLGLGEMEVISDDEAMAVRGSGITFATGYSIVSAIIVDPNTGSFIAGTDGNTGTTSAGNAVGLTLSNQANLSALTLSLNVTTTGSVFNQFVIGGAGGGSTAWVH